ncbi:MAG: carboxypeptidase regulatory-like domain-containing protein, partial [Planctomycetota bacterium]
ATDVAPDARVAAVAAPRTAPTGSLRLTCRFGDDGTAAWGVLVTVTSVGLPESALLQRTVPTGDDGSVLVTGLHAGATRIEADRGGKLRLDVVAGTTTDAELVIPLGIHVRGRVVDEHAAPVPMARIWLSREPRDYQAGDIVASADHAGQFYLRSVEAGRVLSAMAQGLRSAVVQPVGGDVGATVDVELVLRSNGASLLGRVVDPSGAPAGGARVFVGRRDRNWFVPNTEMFGEWRPPLELRTAADGTFAAHGLQPGSKQPVWVRAPGSCVWSRVVELHATGDTSIAVQLETGSVLAGCATDAAGNPLAGTWIDHRSAAWASGRADFDEGREPEWSHSHAQSDADGRYRIDCITPGTLRLRANKDDLEVRGELPVAAGETAVWDPVLVEIAIRGRVVDERGAPLAGVDVTAMPPRGKGNLGSERTDGEGRFTCRRLARVPYVLTFHATGDRARVRPAASRYGVQPGSDELLVILPDAGIPSATIVGRLLDGDGRPPAAARVRASTERMHGSADADVDGATGGFRLGPLPPGTWRLQGSVGEELQNRRSAWSEPFVLVRSEVRDAGVIQMPVTGSIAVTATGPDGAPLGRYSVRLEDSAGWSETAWLVGTLDHGRLRIANVAPGDYRVNVGGENNLPSVYERVTVAAARQSDVDVHLPNGVAVRLVLSPISEPVPMHLWFHWQRDGALHQRYENWWEGNGERTWAQRMLPGSYEVTITSETGKSETNRFTIGPDDPPDRTIAIRLP